MPVILPYPMVTNCGYKAESVEETTALKLLDMHERLKHPSRANQAQNGGGRKPEKFPRHSIDLDSTAEAWQEFHGYSTRTSTVSQERHIPDNYMHVVPKTWLLAYQGPREAPILTSQSHSSQDSEVLQLDATLR